MSEYPNLYAAMAAFQSKLPTIIKDNTAKVAGKEGKQGYTYDYADLADVAEACLPALGAVGVAFIARPTMHNFGPADAPDYRWVLRYDLIHEGGGAETGFWPLTQNNMTMQQKGMEITYARRYSIMAALGVFPRGEDNDANQNAQTGPKNSDAWENAKPAPRQGAKPPQAPPPAQAAAEQRALEKSIQKAQKPNEKAPESTKSLPTAEQSIIDSFVARCEGAVPEDLLPVNGAVEILDAYNSLRTDFSHGTILRAATKIDGDSPGELDPYRSPYSAWTDYLYMLTKDACDASSAWDKDLLNALWSATKKSGAWDLATESGDPFSTMVTRAIDLYKQRTSA